MNLALDKYEEIDEVINICGYTFPHNIKLPEIFFCFFPAVWGWATWKRGWDLYEKDGQKLLNSLEEKKLFDKLNHNNSYTFN